ncbi:MAG: DUF1326 domain-containing protein [Armatimonadota bacterium]|nr:DUF1326 domain-containing protein [bacterium]MDW8322200.1 DUF1326 domain-containing protein [Armatimonadota bacterium]
MKTTLLAAALALLLLPAGAQTLRGDYVEARTCSVYAGGCHYSGEYVTAGREALLFWHIREGRWNGVDLSGLSTLAAVVADNNLAEPSARRQSVIYVDARASKAQCEAIVRLLSHRYAAVLGNVRTVKPVSIHYAQQDKQITVDVPGVATLHVSRYPCKHCVQPHQVWYQPLTPVREAEVASAKLSVYRDRQLGVVWQRGEENSAFVGEFEMR